MLRQLASEETLLPPNFRTIQDETEVVTDSSDRRKSDQDSSSKISRRSFSSFLSARISSRRLQAAFPRLA